MARMVRLVVPNYPHHVTQRGNRRQPTFFHPSDYHSYLTILEEEKEQASVEVWAYCLMPNHVHLVVVPESVDGLAKLFKQTHRRYTSRINKQRGWQGHLWQERFHSCVLDEDHLIATVRYVELNPVRAGLCRNPEGWTWSSVHSHVLGISDSIVSVEPMLRLVNNWNDYLAAGVSDRDLERIRRNSKTGRPLASKSFTRRLEQKTGRILQPRKPGPKPR